MNETKQINIGIVGAGPSGLVMAMALARRGIATTVLTGMNIPIQHRDLIRIVLIQLTLQGMVYVRHGISVHVRRWTRI